jgi:transposase
MAPLDQNNIIIDIESTTHYCDNLVHFLISKAFKVCVLNLIKASSTHNNNISKAIKDLEYIELKKAATPNEIASIHLPTAQA